MTKGNQKYTDRQRQILKRIVDGAKIKAYTPAHGRQCFGSEDDGLCGVLYLSLTMRALRDKGAVICRDGYTCVITQIGINVIIMEPISK